MPVEPLSELERLLLEHGTWEAVAELLEVPVAEVMEVRFRGQAPSPAMQEKLDAHL